MSLYLSIRFSVYQMNTKISAITIAKDTKFGMKVPLYYMHIKFIVNVGSRADRPHYIVNTTFRSDKTQVIRDTNVIVS